MPHRYTNSNTRNVCQLPLGGRMNISSPRGETSLQELDHSRVEQRLSQPQPELKIIFYDHEERLLAKEKRSRSKKSSRMENLPQRTDRRTKSSTTKQSSFPSLRADRISQDAVRLQPLNQQRQVALHNGSSTGVPALTTSHLDLRVGTGWEDTFNSPHYPHFPTENEGPLLNPTYPNNNNVTTKTNLHPVWAQADPFAQTYNATADSWLHVRENTTPFQGAFDAPQTQYPRYGPPSRAAPPFNLLPPVWSDQTHYQSTPTYSAFDRQATAGPHRYNPSKKAQVEQRWSPYAAHREQVPVQNYQSYRQQADRSNEMIINSTQIRRSQEAKDHDRTTARYSGYTIRADSLGPVP